MASDVFISYKSEEYDEANYMKMVLEKNGISCWMAPACIPGGSNYAKEIPNAIQESRIFLLILSKKAQESKWVPKELDHAINTGKIIMPFMIENFTLSDDFNFYLSNVQRYNAYENKATAINRIIQEIKGILGTPGNVADFTTKPSMDTSVKSKPKKKVVNFISKFNPYKWKHADDPKFRFSLNVFLICSLFDFVCAIFVLCIDALDVGISAIVSLLSWYIGYLCCNFMVKINKHYKLLSVILGRVISSVSWIVIFVAIFFAVYAAY